jgi:hypothetical protein
MARWSRPGNRTVGRLPLVALGAVALLLSTAAASAPHAPQGAGQAARDGVATAARAAAGPALPDNDSPTGFWYGTDSREVTVTGSAPYSMPVIGGSYGGYIGMLGNWSHRMGCHGIVVWSGTNQTQAATNFHTYHRGIGVGGYWFMAGPGVDPHYDGTAAEASKWGAQQAAWALADGVGRLTYPVVFMDIEIPGNAPDYTPAPDNGWNSVYTSPCSGVVRISFVPTSLDRADLNGFATYLTSHSSYKAGVYSAPDIWTSIFGTGADSVLPNTYEWTYESFTLSLAHHPSGWCLSGTTTCARFFGGQTSASKYALMWQWSGGGGSNNGVGDFDQIDGNRTP